MIAAPVSEPSCDLVGRLHLGATRRPQQRRVWRQPPLTGLSALGPVVGGRSLGQPTDRPFQLDSLPGPVRH